MMKPVRIAQIGTGHDHASATLASLLRQPDVFDVVGIAEINPDRMDALNRRPFADVPHYSVDELLAMDGLEAVTVETDEELSTDAAQRFADRGVAVHLDKPGTEDTASFNRLADTLEAKGLAFQMGYMYRYNPLVQRFLAEVKEGKFGDVYAVEAQMSVHHPDGKRAWLGKYKGGMMYFLGCHLIDLVLQIKGEPDEVIPLNAATGIAGVDAEDYGFAVLKYADGASFVKTCAHEINGFARRQLVICGSKGTVELKPFEEHMDALPGEMQHTLAALTYESTEKNPWRGNAEALDSGPFNRYDAMMRDFARFVRGESANPYTYAYEKQLHRLLLRCCGM